MRATTTLRWLLGFVLFAVSIPSVGMQASAETARPDATLYELTEMMTVDSLAQPKIRTAVGSLIGTANIGTPLCPRILISMLLQSGLIAAPGPCVIIAEGRNTMDLVSGVGQVWGRVAVVVNSDNAFDAPELVVMTGTFAANLALAGQNLPIIVMEGTLSPEQAFGAGAETLGLTPAKFSGTFRLPFVVNDDGDIGDPEPEEDAHYLADDGKLIEVHERERVFGFPVVRVEVTFDR